MGKGQALLVMLPLAVAGWPCPAAAQDDTSVPGSPSFCLFELPHDGDRRLWINLNLVQYVELRPGELRVYYGGGNFGSGQKLRLPLANQSDGLAFIKRMQAASAACRGGSPQ